MAGGTYRLNCSWRHGEAGEQRKTIGPVAATDNEVPNHLGLLRVGYDGGTVAEPVSATVYPADNGTALGPIDVPFCMVLEVPCELRLRPAGVLVSSVSLTLSVVPVLGHADRLYATRTSVAIVNQVIPLPQWVRGVAVLAPAAFQFRDRSSVAISNALTGAHDRPAMATELLVTVAGTVVLYY